MAGGKRVYTEAFDGRRAWQWQEGKGEKEESATATAALRHGVELPGHLYGLHELRGRGHRIDLVGREKIDRADYYVLRVTLADGYTTSLYVDPETWRITHRRDMRPLHVDIDPTPTTIEQRMWDFHQISGVSFQFASTDTDLGTGKTLESTRVKSIKVNPTIEESIFSKL